MIAFNGTAKAHPLIPAEAEARVTFPGSHLSEKEIPKETFQTP